MADQAAAMKSQMRTKDNQISALTAQVAILTRSIETLTKKLLAYQQCNKEVGETTEEEEIEGQRRERGTSEDTAGRMDGTQ